jgi:signal transduction histidine kinase
MPPPCFPVTRTYQSPVVTSSVPAPAASASDLASLLKARRQDLINRWSAAVRSERAPASISQAELIDHIPRFIDELIGALHPDAMSLTSLGENADQHGAQRLNLGFNVAEVVREYGTLHRCVIEIAGEGMGRISLHEQEVIGRWLNAGLANAVSQYVTDRDAELQRAASEHLGFIAHEIRTPLSSARIAFELLRTRELAGGGRAVELLERGLRRTRGVIDNVLDHTSLSMGLTPRREALQLQKKLVEVAFDFSAEAQVKGIDVVVAVPAELVIEADARLLHSAVANLLQNALKFSQPNSTLTVRAKRTPDHVSIEVEDACGGLPPGRADDLFKPLVQGEQRGQRGQGGSDETGFGLGLAIAQQAARAHDGTLNVRDLPGKGCIFTLELSATAVEG